MVIPLVQGLHWTRNYHAAKAEYKATSWQAATVANAAFFLVAAVFASVVWLLLIGLPGELTQWQLGLALMLSGPCVAAFVATFVTGIVGNVQYLLRPRPDSPWFDLPYAYFVLAFRYLRGHA